MEDPHQKTWLTVLVVRSLQQQSTGFCLGEFKELSSVVANQRQRVKIVETGETIQMTSPDQVLISGVLQSGAVASVHLKGGTANGTGFLFEIHGTEGALAIVPTDPRQATYIQVSEFTVRGAQAGKPLADGVCVARQR